jgi:hypothetical protein
MPRTTPLHPAWRDYRRRRLFAIVVFLSYMPVVAGIGMPLAKVLGENAIGAVALSHMAIWLLAIIRLGWFRCPRCRNAFHVLRLYGNPLARRCLHCGLAKWADPSERAVR